VCFLVIALAFLFLGGMPADGFSDPPAWETAIREFVVRTSLARQADGLINPIAGSDEDLLAGMKRYRNTCMGCHGGPAHVSPGGTTGFYPRVPQFPKYPPNLTIPQMFVAVKYGIRYSGMGANAIPDRQIWQVATFLSRLKSLPPAVHDAWTSPPSQ
jgi:mono/diheme cytochrome c family protein